MQNSKNIKFLSFGSPLLDIASDKDDDFIHNNGIQLNKTIHQKMIDVPFFHEFISSPDTKQIPGGCQFNAMRVFNWMYEKEDNTDTVGFLGSVGEDEFGETYQTMLEMEGIVPFFETIPGDSTGICLVIGNKHDRAHITELGASTKISNEYFKRVEQYFQNAKLIFTELYILPDQKNLCFTLAEMGLSNDKVYGFNLPSREFFKKFMQDIVEIISYADIVFANFDEAIDFCTYFGLDKHNSLDVIIKQLASLPKKNVNKNRVFVITAGKHPAWVCEYDFINKSVVECFSSEIVYVPEEKIVHTNGAGDSFAGGFLSQYMKKRSLSECMKAGHWAASVIIQQYGFVIPSDIKYDYQQQQHNQRTSDTSFSLSDVSEDNSN